MHADRRVPATPMKPDLHCKSSSRRPLLATEPLSRAVGPLFVQDEADLLVNLLG